MPRRNMSSSSIFQPTEIYFPPYSEEEIYQIPWDRIHHGLFPDVVSKPRLELTDERTMICGDLQVGRHCIIQQHGGSMLH
jgi:cell division control protein 6